ncbi:ABC transporter permease [Pectinatus haikarae]|uniref:NitT/TauT family transport system permease protein n=1 Tax=Pectinatus haikarae TaxID=349096 RepID=A0ABT9Y9K3_9FIRM|nr:ABC transporter permease subunit [Pectinatus haikarae]MDQ0204520.1 NitT/TauT family transport system permease protein [Pectinatus haikarae]
MEKLRPWLPLFSILLASFLDIWLPDSSLHTPTKAKYFLWFNIILGIFFTAGAIRTIFWRNKGKNFITQAPFYAAVIFLLNIFNLVSKKYALLPVIFFPSLDRVFSVIVEDSFFLASCLASSAQLLFAGFAIGAAAGILTGIAVGFNKVLSYWINPLIRAIGPMPPTAWIPIVLVVFPTTFSGSVFLIALSVWFPTTIMTAGGIQNIPNVYFEVASTLGAGKYYQILKVGIPAAMPQMFLGIFNGAGISFVTLMTAELLGVKNGIGWYINWQKDMMAYANVYAGLIIIAVSFYLLVMLLFKVRDRVLVWQKGVIKW